MIRVREMDIGFYRHYSNFLEAARQPAWRYNEMKPCGLNHNNFITARLYDSCHRLFRDFEREAERIIALLALGREATVIDMGCGTGAFALRAAKYYRKVHAVDISKAMLGRARRKARKARPSSIEFHHGGFLTYEHEDGRVDAINSVAVLHHLPDFWKQVGLRRMAGMLKPKGRLHLFDIVFSFDADRHEPCLKRFVKTVGGQMGATGQIEAETHVRDEYSTCDWIMDGMLDRAGFRIDKAERTNEFIVSYLCTRKAE